jgi:hypothetical protein
LGSRGVRMAREKREELERLRDLARAKRMEKEAEAELEGSSANDGEAEVVSGLKEKTRLPSRNPVSTPHFVQARSRPREAHASMYVRIKECIYIYMHI